jgi:FkbM family methyltransferase
VRRLLRGTSIQNLWLINFFYSIYVRVVQSKLPTDGSNVFVSFRNLNFWVPKNDITILPTLIRGTYEEDELSEVLKHLPNCDSFIDVGANVGIYSVLSASSAVLRDGVHSFEPNPPVAELLRRNLKQLRLEDLIKVTTYQLALSDRIGKVLFEVSRFHGTGRLGQAASQRTIEVEQSTLDSVFSGRRTYPVNALIKIDVEGFEPKVLIGARCFIRSAFPKILVEVCGESSKDVGCDWFESVELLAENYSKMTIWGPQRSVDDISLPIALRLNRCIADGRLHNVLFEK